MKKKKATIIITSILLIILIPVLSVTITNAVQKINSKIEYNKYKNIELTNVGDYSADLKRFLIPKAMSGVGIKVSDLDGELIPNSANINTAFTEKVQFVVTLCNAKEVDNKLEFLLFLDNKQIPYSINNDKTEIWNYSIYLPAFSYANLLVEVDKSNLNDNVNIHDIWFFCEQLADTKTTLENRQPYFSTDYHLILTSNGSAHWSKILTENTVKTDADENLIKKFDLKTTITCGKASINQYTVSAKANKELTANIELYNKRNDEKYQTFIVLNGRAIPLTENGDSILWTSSENTVHNFSFKFTMPNNIGHGKIYAVSFPIIDTAENLPFTSERMNVEVE